MRVGIFFMALVGIALASCATTPKHELAEDGIPVWIDRPEEGLPEGVLAAVAESDFAAADVEAAKTDAETAVKNRLADQIEAKVGRLTERLSSAMRDLASGRTLGERSIRDINQNFQEIALRGVRYSDYFFYPNRKDPTKVWVRGYISVDSNKMSQEIVAAMMSDAVAEKLEMKHEEAQLRFEKVRQDYLREEAGGGAPAPAPTP